MLLPRKLCGSSRFYKSLQIGKISRPMGSGWSLGFKTLPILGRLQNRWIYYSHFIFKVMNCHFLSILLLPIWKIIATKNYFFFSKFWYCSKRVGNDTKEIKSCGFSSPNRWRSRSNCYQKQSKWILQLFNVFWCHFIERLMDISIFDFSTPTSFNPRLFKNELFNHELFNCEVINHELMNHGFFNHKHFNQQVVKFIVECNCTRL